MNQNDMDQFRRDLALISADLDGLRVMCSRSGDTQMDAIQALRRNEYRKRGAAYLCEESGDFQRFNELIDERSLHLSVWRAQSLIGSMRITPSPFELSRETGMDFIDQDYVHHMEFSRLIMTDEAGFRQPTEKLMAAACLKALDAGKVGLIAMCRPVQARLFERYGLMPITPQYLTLPQRGHGTYAVVAASWRTMFSHIGRVAQRVAAQQDLMVKDF